MKFLRPKYLSNRFAKRDRSTATHPRSLIRSSDRKERERFRRALVETLEERCMMNATSGSQERLVNSLIPRLQSSDQQSTALAMNSQGNSVVVYAGYRDDDPDGVFQRRFSSGGSASAVELVNVERRQEQSSPSVAIGENNQYAICWQGRGRDESQGLRDSNGVFIRWFSPSGQPLTGEVLVNQQTEGVQENADLTILPDGTAVIVWAGASREDASGVYARRFSALGVPLSPQVLLHQPDSVRNDYPSVSSDASGNVFVTWSRRTGGNSAWDILVRKFDSQLKPLGSAQVIGSGTDRPELAGTQVRSRIATDSDGSSILTWTGQDVARNQWNIYAQRVLASGDLSGSPFRVNSQIGGVQKDPDVAASSDGRFVISWTRGLWDGSGWEVVASIFDSSGSSIENELPVHTVTVGYASGHQEFSAVVWGQGASPQFAWSGRGVNDRGGVWTRGPELQKRPRISTIPNQTIPEGQLLEVPIVVTPAYEGQIIQLGVDPLDAPRGVVIDPVRKVLMWRPTETHGPGDFSVTILANDATRPDLPSRQSFQIRVSEVNQTPTIIAPKSLVVDEGQTLTATIQATDADLPKNQFTFFLDPLGLPEGLTIDAQTGILNWATKEIDGPQSYSIVVGVKDNGQPRLESRATIEITVRETNQPPELLPIFDQTISIGQTLTLNATAIDPDLPNNKIRFRMVAAPSGASIDGDLGTIRYTAEQAGNHLVTIEAYDDGKPSLASQTAFRILVDQPLDQRPQFKDLPANQSLPELIPWSTTLTANPAFPTQRLAFRLLGSVPGGLQLTSAGKIDWIPTEAQGPANYPVTVEVFDVDAPQFSSQATILLQVTEINSQPIWSNPGQQTIDELQLWTMTLQASDLDLPPNSLNYEALSLPDGAGWDPLLRQLSWRPTESQGPGEFTARFRVTDNGSPNLSNELSIPIQVREVNTAPILNPIQDKFTSPSERLSFVATARDNDRPSNTLHFSLAGQTQQGMSIERETGVFTWQVPSQFATGIYPVTIVVTDSVTPALSDQQTFLIEVTAPWIELREDTRLTADHTTEFILPSGTAALKVHFRFLMFDSLDPRNMRDAFEVALVDESDRPMVGIVGPLRDAFFSISEGGLVTTGDGVQYDLSAGTITVDTTQIPGGKSLKLIRRLVGNDSDQQTRVEIRSSIDYLSQSPISQKSNSTPGTEYLLPDWSAPIDWSAMDLATSDISLTYGNTWFDEDTNRIVSRVSVTNKSQIPVRGPLLLAANQLTELSVIPLATHGQIPRATSLLSRIPASLAGTPYWDLSDKIPSGVLSANSSLTFDLLFEAPNHTRFSFEPVFLAPRNSAPIVAGIQDTSVRAGTAFRYQPIVSDGDQDQLSFQLVAGPVGLALDPKTGAITWNTTPAHVGTHLISWRVSDSFGGSTVANLSLEVINDSGSPPTIKTLPVIDAFVGETYRYNATAVDPNHDHVLFSLIASPSQMALKQEGDSALLSWLPKYSDVNKTYQITLQVTDQRDGTTDQTFEIVVHPAKNNSPPIFVTQPTTTFRLPNFTARDSEGDVFPKQIQHLLVPGKATVENVRLAWDPQSSPRSTDVVLVVDESGSMAEQSWLQDVVEKLDLKLSQLGITDNRYSVVGFGGPQVDPRMLLRDGSAEIVILSQDGETLYHHSLSNSRQKPSFHAPTGGTYYVVLKTEDYLGRDSTAAQSWSSLFQLSSSYPRSLTPSGMTRYSGQLQKGVNQITWQAAAGRPFFLSSETATSDILATLVTPDGNRLVAGESLQTMSQTIIPTISGTYTLHLFGPEAAAYSLNVVDLGKPDNLIGFSATVSGTFANTKEKKVFQFEANSGSNILLDRQSIVATGSRSAYFPKTEFTLISPSGAILTPAINSSAKLSAFGSGFCDAGDVGTYYLPASGRYTLIANPIQTTELDYRFQIFDLGSSAESIQIGQRYSHTLSSSAASERFQFPAVASHSYQFDAIATDSVSIDILDPVGNVIASGHAGTPFTWRASTSGTYRILLSPSLAIESTSNEISWIMTDLGFSQDQGSNRRAISFSEEIKDEISYPGEIKRYSLQVEAGDLLYVDTLSAEHNRFQIALRNNSCGLLWTTSLTHAVDSSDFTRTIDFNGLSRRLTEINESGTWTLEITSSLPGTFGFRVMSTKNAISQPTTGTWNPTLTQRASSSLYKVSLQAGQTLDFTLQPWMKGAEIQKATTALRSEGLIEDGYDGVQFALERLPFRPNASRQVILVTDEDRDIVDPLQSYSTLDSSLRALGIDFHVLANAKIRNENDKTLLGIDFDANQLFGIESKANDSFDRYQVNSPTFPSSQGTTLQDYYELAKSDQGDFWDIMSLREGDSVTRSSFTKAFVEQLQKNIQEDVAITLKADRDDVPISIGAPAWENRAVVFPVTMTGNGDLQEYDLEFATSNTRNIFLGSIPVGIGNGYGYDFLAVDPDRDPIEYSLLSGPANSGILISNSKGPSQTLAWSPTAVGQYNFQLQAIDPLGGIDQQSWKVVVEQAFSHNTSPVINSPTTLVYEVDYPIALPLKATDSDGDKLTFQLALDPQSGKLPPQGMTIDPDSGLLRWIPNRSQRGTHPIAVRVTDGQGGRSLTRFTIRVIDPNPLFNDPPRFDSIAPTFAFADTNFSYSLQTTDPNGDEVTLTLLQGPDDMGLDRETGKLFWRPEKTDLGKHTVVIRAQDQWGALSFQQFDLLTFEKNSAPRFISEPTLITKTGKLWSYPVELDDLNGDVVKLRLDEKTSPSGAILDPSNHTLTFTPVENGLYHFSIIADDLRGGVSEQTFVLEASENGIPPQFLTTTNARVTANTPLEMIIVIADQDGDSDLTLELDRTASFEDLLLQSVATPSGYPETSKAWKVLWTPKNEGVFEGNLRATDSTGRSTIQRLSIAVHQASSINRPPVFTTTPKAPATRDLPFEYRVEAYDPERDRFTLTLDTESIGRGMLLSSDGLLTWTPSTAGEYRVVVKAEDDLGNSSVYSFLLPVLSNSPPRFESLPVDKAIEGQPWVYRPVVLDPNVEDSTTLHLISAPDGVRLSPNGELRWDNPLIGNHRIELEVRDSNSDSARQSFQLQVVSATNRSPQINGRPRSSIKPLQTYQYRILASDPDNDPIYFRILTAPSGVTLSETGLIRWTPTSLQRTHGTSPHLIQVEASDRRGGSNQVSWQIDVRDDAVNDPPVITGQKAITAIAGRPLIAQMIGQDPQSDTLFWSLNSPSRGETISPWTGEVRWQPTLKDIGSHSLQVNLSDLNGGTTTKEIPVNVRGGNSPPVISGQPETLHRNSLSYRASFTAVDDDTDPFTFSFLAAPTHGEPLLDPKSGQLIWKPTINGTYNFKVAAIDDFGDGSSIAFSVIVNDIGNNLPPRFLNSSIGVGERGSTYSRQFTALDPEGDSISYQVITAPLGLTIDASGRVIWNVPPNYPDNTVEIELQARDTIGATGRIRFKLPVKNGNHAPEFLSSPKPTLVAGQQYAYRLSVTDKDDDDLAVSLKQSPPGANYVDSSNTLLWSTSTADIGRHRFILQLSDDRINTPVEQDWFVDVIADQTAPTVTIETGSTIGNVGETIRFKTLATDNVGVEVISATFQGKIVSLSKQGFGTIDLTTPGQYSLQVAATDKAGNRGTAEKIIVVRDPLDKKPTASWISPLASSEITATVPLIVSAKDPENRLTSARVWLNAADRSESKTLIAEQLASAGDYLPNQDNWNIGNIDPTILQNGSYLLTFEITDAGFNTSATTLPIQVQGKMKLGTFQTRLTDLSLYLGSTTLIVSRVYDSLRSREEGDFGPGWFLDLGVVSSRIESSTLGEQGSGRFQAFVDGTEITITLSDGTEETHRFEPIPATTMGGQVIDWLPAFSAPRTSKIKVLGPEHILKRVGNTYETIDGVTYNPSDPAIGNYLDIKLENGTIQRTSATTGRIQYLTDRAGQRIEIDGTGIHSSSGKSLFIERDFAGRILSIRDPKGAQLRYEYNSQGQLAAFIDRQQNSISTEQPKKNLYFYDNVHTTLLQKAIDSEGRTVFQHSFDISGRLIESRDAFGQGAKNQFDAVQKSIQLGDQQQSLGVIQMDPLGRPITITIGSGNMMEISYNDIGLPIQLRNRIDDNPLQSISEVSDIKLEFDSYARPVRKVDPAGNTTQFFYDHNSGEMRSAVDPLGNATRFAYDDSGVMVDKENHLKQAVRREYDDKGNEIAVYAVDRSEGAMGDCPASDTFIPYCSLEQTIKKSTYDKFGRLTAETDRDGIVTHYEYDETNRIRKQWFESDHEGITIRSVREYTYDANDRPTQTREFQQLPDGTTRFITTTGQIYDSTGRILIATDSANTSIEHEYDAGGRHIKTRTTDEYGTPFVAFQVYDSYGRVMVQTDAVPEGEPIRSGQRMHYDQQGKLIRTDRLEKPLIEITGSATTRQSKIVSFGTVTAGATVSADGRQFPSQIVDGEGRVNERFRNQHGNTVERRDVVYDTNGKPEIRIGRTVFDEHGRVIASTDAYAPGQTSGITGTRFFYNSSGERIRSEYVTGLRIDVQRLPNGTYSSTLVHPGELIDRDFLQMDDAGRLRVKQSDDGARSRVKYDPQGRTVEAIEYDNDSQMVTQITRTYYDETNNATYVIQPNVLSPNEPTTANVTFKDKLDRMIRTEKRTGVRIELQAVEGDRHTTKLTSAGRVEYFESSHLDSRGQVLRKENSLGSVSEYQYDDAGNVLVEIGPSVWDPQLRGWIRPRLERVYLKDRLQSEQTGIRQLPDGQLDRAMSRTISYQYNLQGMKTKTIFEDGTFLQTIYDDAGQMIAEVDRAGQRTDLVYDKSGRLAAIRQPLIDASPSYRLRTEFGYDDRGNQTEVRTGIIEYLDGSMDRSGMRVRTEKYDVRDRYIEQLRSGHLAESRRYDASGRIESIDNPSGTRVSYRWSAEDTEAQRRVVYYNRSTDPADAAPREIVTQQSTRNGRSVSYAEGTTVTEMNGEGQTLRITNPSGAIGYSYNHEGRLETITTYQAKRPAAIESQWRYDYDLAGRLETVSVLTRAGATLSSPETYRYEYDVFGRVTSLVYPDGTFQSRSYDKLGNMIGVTYFDADATPNNRDDNPKRLQFVYSFDVAGNRTGTEEHFWNPQDRSLHYMRSLGYRYDAAARLVEETSYEDGRSNRTRYEYDAAGNRLTESTDSDGDSIVDTVIRSTYDLQDRLLEQTQTEGSKQTRTRYFYGEGNRSLQPLRVETREANTDRLLESKDFEYDLFGYLESFEHWLDGEKDQRVREEYSNDPDGQRLTRREIVWEDEQLKYDRSWLEIYDSQNPTGHSQLLELRDAESGRVERLVTPGLRLIAEANRDAVSEAYITDGLGSVRRWGLDASRDHDLRYGSFGNLTDAAAQSLPLHGYTSELMIDGGSLLHLRQRTYDPSLGRMLQPDTFSGLVTEPASLHRYLYAANNPLRYHDPSGNLFVLFDGTWNHDQPQFFPPHVWFTNVVKMRDAFINGQRRDFEYLRGVGNQVDNPDGFSQIVGGAFAYGMTNIINSAISKALPIIRDQDKIVVTGFSRGSTTALQFGHEISRLAPDVTIDSMLLYDTVASVGIPGNGINFGFNTSLSPNVKRAYHAVAYQEDRSNFPATNILDRARRVEQKVFWGTHGDVGGGYRARTEHSDNTLFWMSEKLKKDYPFLDNPGNFCAQCGRDNSHWPHPAQTYLMHGGVLFGESLRPTVEYPAIGTIALAFFYDDMDFSNVNLDRFAAQYDSFKSIALYLRLTDAFSSGMAFIPYAGPYVSSIYRIYHYAALYTSVISWFTNRI